MLGKLRRKTLKLWVLGLTSIALIQPASAQTNGTVPGGVNCTPPTGVQPLFDFLNSITELAFLAGIGLATLTFVVAGTCFIVPGQDYNRLGKNIAKNGLIGAVLLLSANIITSYLVTQLGGNMC